MPDDIEWTELHRHDDPLLIARVMPADMTLAEAVEIWRELHPRTDRPLPEDE